MFWLVFSALLLIGASVLSLLLPAQVKRWIVCPCTLAACILGLIPTFAVLWNRIPSSLDLPGTLPGMRISLGLDSLSAFFLVPLFFLAAIVAIYAFDYTRIHTTLGQSLPFFPLLVASMALVLTARDAFLFLISWEIMSLSSFFLVTTDHTVREVRHAGWIYLVSTHLATAFLLVFFVALSHLARTFSFSGFEQQAKNPVPFASVWFLLLLVGFGAKAGIFPLHLWLPHAHPAAPSYISALMSGVMIKTGIYGILRSLPWLGPPPAWWGSLLVALGIGSAVMGILMAHGRKDIKRILAYSSIENIGIIAIGLGLGIWGLATNHPNILALGIAGALCHVWNHALFKGLWFLGAGCLAESTGTRIADRLGGLAKKMPSVAASSGVATVALCGVPPLNGFVGECLIYFGLFLSVQSFSGWPLALAVAGIGGMALTGGLALALFSKLYGTIFLGEPRTPAAASPHPLPRLMRWPLLLLAALCLLLGAVPLLLVPWLESALISWAPPGLFKQTVDPLILLYFLSLGSQALWFLMILLYACTRWLTHRRSIRRGVTWDCGYHAPTPRMQYTAASFSEPITFLSSPLLRLRRRFTHPEGFFPPPTSFQEQSEDLAEGSFFKPLFEAVGSAFAWLRARQQGRVQNYLIWIFLTLLVLLFWEVWFGI